MERAQTREEKERERERQRRKRRERERGESNRAVPTGIAPRSDTRVESVPHDRLPLYLSHSAHPPARPPHPHTRIHPRPPARAHNNSRVVGVPHGRIVLARHPGRKFHLIIAVPEVKVPDDVKKRRRLGIALDCMNQNGYNGAPSIVCYMARVGS